VRHRGIGRAIALRLAADGADVAVVDLNLKKAGKVADEIAALGRKSTSTQADVSNRDQVHSAVERAHSDTAPSRIGWSTPARSSTSTRARSRVVARTVSPRRLAHTAAARLGHFRTRSSRPPRCRPRDSRQEIRQA
jgi:hypothetical protein